ncbi:MAG TPA: hypothetical protein VII43_02905 [Opitutaceae bacterium]
MGIPQSENADPMTIDEFRALRADDAPAGLSGALFALLQDAKGDWSGAHESAQRDDSPGGAWVHGYLHRKEGEPGNAAYWYRCAGRPLPTCSLEAEWGLIAGELLRGD